jgi:uncharacterized protein (TIGR02996 family)
MSVEGAFLQDIIDNPDEDAPRLIYADWLEEQGDPEGLARAEFIRVQIELETLDEPGPRLWRLREREAELLGTWRAEWVPPGLRELVLGEEFRRGFVEGVTLTAGQFLERAEDVFRLAPVRRLRLSVGAPFVGYPLERLPLQLREQRAALGRAVADVAGSPFLKRLTALHPDFPLGSAEVLALAGSPHPRNLRELSVRWQDAEPAAVRGLLASPVCAGLRRLDMNTGQDGGAIEALAEARLRHLTALAVRLWGDSLSVRALQLLGCAVSPDTLADLDLRGHGIAGDGLRALAEGPLLGRLKTLRLRAALLASGGLAVLADGLAGGQLTRLDLSYNGIPGAQLSSLGCCPGLSALRELGLSGNVSTSAGLAALAESPHLHRLAALWLHFNGVGDSGVRALAASPVAQGLAWLDLKANRITSDGALALAESPYLKGFHRLELQRNDIGPLAQAALRERFGPAVQV